MNDQTYAMIFFENEGVLSPVYMDKKVSDFKNDGVFFEGVMYAFDDLDEGFLFYEDLVSKINNDIDWSSVHP